jgi:hypothetical protein
MSNHARLRCAPLLALVLSGCAMTETTTTVRVLPGAPTQRIRLVRPDAAPLSAVWRQDGSSLVGQLSFANECSTETLQVNQRTQVTTTHPNPKYSTGAYVAGALLTVAGVALIANGQGKNEQVTCGYGDEAPRSGDTCESEAGAWREIGAITIGAGLGAVLGGLIVKSRKPVVETHDLPSEQQVRPQPNQKACGDLPALEGAIIRATLSSGGTWTGTADGGGAVRIDLAGAAIGRGARATFTLESVRSGATPLSLAGAPLGALALESPRATSSHPAAARASSVFLR